MTKSDLCGGRGSLATVVGERHWTADNNGRSAPTDSFVIPIVVPFVCTIKRALENKVTA